MIECECTKLTGKCRHDCPICGGEGILAKKPRREQSNDKSEVKNVRANQNTRRR